MRAVSLLGVFILAKMLVLAGRSLPLSLWVPLAYLWQDVLVVLLFAGVESTLLRRPWIAWGLYAAASLYAAVNVPVACVLSTPLTWPLLRAARGTLADSILHCVTAANLLRIGLVLATAAALPLLVRRFGKPLRRRWWVAAITAAVVVICFGPLASARLETQGLHRNALAMLVTTALPRVTAADFDGDWRASPFDSAPAADMGRFRGAAARRNVVIVHLESTGARYLRPYGAVEDPMPHLTELARQAIVFESAYTVYPETIRSFFAVQCSTYPALDTKPEAYEPVRSPGLAGVLAGAGYRTGLFHSGRFSYLGMESVVRGRGYQTAEDAGDIGGERDSSFGIDESSTVRRILAWIDALPAGRPFFVTYLPIAGHHPYDSPDGGPFPEDTEIHRYHNALHYSDAALAELLAGLRERGLDRRTVFVIFGDHGEAFGQHEGNFGHTLFLYEENVRVPYLIAAPGLFEEQVRADRVVSLVDTAPTVLDLLGLPIPGEYQGRSLLGSEPEMALFGTDYSLGLLGLRDGRWKFIHELDSGQSQLFDMSEDAEEKHNRATEFPERVTAYREHLLHWSAAQKYRILRRP
jgi:phosphoglycerol transferase MdoB-like AlkP superfamily enzyme